MATPAVAGLAALLFSQDILRIRVPRRTRCGTYSLAVSATGDGLTRSVNLSMG
jgi:hypothetical protein